ACGPGRVERLQANAAALRDAIASHGLAAGRSRTQILPLHIGDAKTAMATCELALERGVFAQAIRPPTVPEGTSRLRLAVMATHRAGELRRAARTLAEAARATAGAGDAAVEPPVPFERAA